MSHQMKYLALALGLLLASSGAAQAEHPAEHPSAGSGSEHPAEKKADKSAVTKKDMAAAVRDHVKKQTKKGWMTVEDPATGETLKLKLTRVHDDKLAKVGKDTYFACADFKASNGKTYDLDIFMKGKDKGSLSFTEVTVHKEEGKERYTWEEKKGKWLKVTLAEEGDEEHPKGEHPSEEHPKAGSGSEHPKEEHPKAGSGSE